MLGRGTFYLHYKDIHDLLDTLENEYVEAIGNIIDEYYPIAPAANISDLTEKLFRYITVHEEQLRLLFHHISTRSFIDRLIIRQRYVFSRLVEEGGCDAAYNAVEMSFMISGFAGVILDYWFLGSLPLSEKEIIYNLNRLLLNFPGRKGNEKRRPVMRNIRITLAYEGTAYSGFQRQENSITVQEILETALQKLTGTKTTLYFAARTDAGVHAYGQECTFIRNLLFPAIVSYSR